MKQQQLRPWVKIALVLLAVLGLLVGVYGGSPDVIDKVVAPIVQSLTEAPPPPAQ
jgi:hypothetical protein